MTEFVNEVGSSVWLTQAFYKVGLQCPERIWPGLNLKNKDFLFVDPNSKSSYQLHLNESWFTVSSVPTRDLVGAPQGQRAFVFSENGDRKSLSVLIDRGRGVIGDPIHNAFSLAFHEGFHKYCQGDQDHSWPPYTSDSSRSSTYPENWEPLYYRDRVIQLMKEGFHNRTEQATKVCEAKYWHEKFKTEYPEQAQKIRGTDISEGTAEYAERKALQVARHTKGCFASNRELEALEMREDRPVYADDIDSQSYPLGEYAGFILDRLDPSGRWKATVAKGVTPTEVLFSKVAGCPTRAYQDDLASKNRFREDTTERNKKNSSTFGPLLDQWNSNDFVRVAIPTQAKQGSMRLSGFYDMAGIKDATIYNRVSMQLQSPDIDVELENAMVIATDTSENPCQTFSNIILIPKSSVPIRALTLTSSGASGSISSFRRVETQGKTWICAGAK